MSNDWLFSLFLLFFSCMCIPSIVSNCAEGHTNASSRVNDKAPRSAPDTELPQERDLKHWPDPALPSDACDASVFCLRVPFSSRL